MTQHTATQQNNCQYKYTLHNNTQLNDIQHYNIHYSDTQSNNLKVIAILFSIFINAIIVNVNMLCCNARLIMLSIFNCDKFYFTFKFEYRMWVWIYQKFKKDWVLICHLSNKSNPNTNKWIDIQIKWKT